MDKKELVTALKKRHSKLLAERAPWEPVWDDVAKYCNPRRTFTESVSQPWDAAKDVYDRTAANALETLANGLQGHAVNPSTDWFRLRVGKNDDPPTVVKEYLFDLEKAAYAALMRSNFYEAINEDLMDGGGLGTAILYAEEDLEEKMPRFTVLHPKECCLAQDRFGKVNMLFREFVLPRDEAQEEFDLPEGLALLGEDLTIYHAVYPSDLKSLKTGQKKKYSSVYWLAGHDEPIRISGYKRFPYMVWRWRRHPQDVYGIGPGITALSDILMLNQMSKDMLIKSQVNALGMWDAPAYMRDEGVIIEPGGVHYSRSPGHRLQRLDTGGNSQEALIQIQDRRELIKQAFYVDVFLMLANQSRDMTAQEVIERTGEKAAILAAIQARMNSELLNPVLQYTLEIEAEAGRLPPPPEGLDPKDLANLRIEYVGPLAMNQKRYHESSGYTKALAQIMPVLQISPEAADNLDWNAFVRGLAEAAGVPPDGVIDAKKVAKLREARAQAQAQAQQQQAQMQQMELAAKMAKNMPQGLGGSQGAM